LFSEYLHGYFINFIPWMQMLQTFFIYFGCQLAFVVGYCKSASPPKPFAEPDWKTFANMMMMMCCGMFPRFPGFGLMSGMGNEWPFTIF
jgi:hypothetical protein